MDRGLKFQIQEVDGLYDAAKTKALISCPETAQLIRAFVLGYAKIRFSNDAAHIQIKSVSDMIIM